MGKESGPLSSQWAVKQDIVTKALASVLRTLAFQMLAGVCLQLSLVKVRGNIVITELFFLSFLIWELTFHTLKWSLGKRLDACR